MSNALMIQGKVKELAELRAANAETLARLEELEKEVKELAQTAEMGINLKSKYGINVSYVSPSISRSADWSKLLGEFPEAEKFIKVSDRSAYVRLYYSDLK